MSVSIDKIGTWYPDVNENLSLVEDERAAVDYIEVGVAESTELELVQTSVREAQHAADLDAMMKAADDLQSKVAERIVEIRNMTSRGVEVTTVEQLYKALGLSLWQQFLVAINSPVREEELGN